jgi:hypothetical protein
MLLSPPHSILVRLAKYAFRFAMSSDPGCRIRAILARTNLRKPIVTDAHRKRLNAQHADLCGLYMRTGHQALREFEPPGAASIQVLGGAH